MSQKDGRIINTASMLSFIVPAYVVSKGGVLQLIKMLCNEWADSDASGRVQR